MLAVCQGRGCITVRALGAYLDAMIDRERRLMYLGDLVWLAAIRCAPEMAESVVQYSRFCADLDGLKRREKTAEEIYNDLIAGLEGRETR